MNAVLSRDLCPAEFAHGYSTDAVGSIIQIDQRGILWNDLDMNISWRVDATSLSEKDKKNSLLSRILQEFLPRYRT